MKEAIFSGSQGENQNQDVYKRQLLEMLKQIHTDVIYNFLANIGHHLAADFCQDNACLLYTSTLSLMHFLQRNTRIRTVRRIFMQGVKILSSPILQD